MGLTVSFDDVRWSRYGSDIYKILKLYHFLDQNIKISMYEESL